MPLIWERTPQHSSAGRSAYAYEPAGFFSWSRAVLIRPSNSVRSVPSMPSSEARISAFLSSRHALNRSFLRSAVARVVVQDFFKNVIFPDVRHCGSFSVDLTRNKHEKRLGKTSAAGAVRYSMTRAVMCM